MIPVFAIFAFTAQGLALGVDEFVFHRKRSLPLWERLGHPLDTLSVLLCLGITLLFPAQSPWAGLYIGLAIFSCLLVTKDEWVHTELCQPLENWLHAILFLLHPALLWAVYGLWQSGGNSSNLLLKTEALLCGIFMLYQLLYWNLPWRKNSLK